MKLRSICDDEIVNDTVGALLRDGEYRVTPDLDVDRWRDLVHLRCQGADLNVQFFDGSCGCCSSVVWVDWDGEPGPLRLAVDAIELALEECESAMAALDAARGVLDQRTRLIPFDVLDLDDPPDLDA
jgi:hypothetical protein